MVQILEILFLAQEPASGQWRREMFRQEILDGKVGGCDDIFPRFFFMDLLFAGPGHQCARLADNVDDLLDCDCHGLCL